MKLNLAESVLDQLTLQRATLTDPKFAPMIDQEIASYQLQVRKYEKEKAGIKKKAEDYQKEYDGLNPDRKWGTLGPDQLTEIHTTVILHL